MTQYNCFVFLMIKLMTTLIMSSKKLQKKVKVKKSDHKKNQLSNQKEFLSKTYISVFSNSGAFQKSIYVRIKNQWLSRYELKKMTKIITYYFKKF